MTTAELDQTKLYVDYRQSYSRYIKVDDPLLVVAELKWGDLCWYIPQQSKWLRIEEKKIGDFSTSYYSRRLARQLRTLLHDDTAIPALALSFTYEEGLETWRMSADRRIFSDLAKWRTLGGCIFLVPGSEPLQFYKSLFKITRDEGVNLYSVISGKDAPKPIGTTEFQRLVGTFPGIGVKTARRLEETFNGSYMAALNTPAKEWPHYITANTRHYIQELQQ